MRHTFFYFLYNLMTLLLLPLFFIFVGIPLFFQADARKQLSQRFAFYRPSFFKKIPGKQTYWVHASSVGEVMLSRVFVAALRARFPEMQLVFSTSTATGQAAAVKHLSGVAHVIYFPYDFFWIVNRALDCISPDLFIFVETEIWPNLMRGLSKRGAASVMINGRISDRSFPGYERFTPFLLQVLPKASLFLMQSEDDARKITLLGAPAQKVRITGNMKYDQDLSQNTAQISLSDLGLMPDAQLFVAGSTRNGEEAHVIAAWRLLREKQPKVVLLIAPRHLKRLPEIEVLLKKEQLLFIRKTQIAGTFPSKTSAFCPVILLDTLGELSAIYPLARFVFIGGGLAPLGGQNPLEAAGNRRPVFFGPHMDNFKDISEALLSSGGAQVVESGEDLGEKLVQLADSQYQYEEMANAAYDCVQKKRGAVKQHIDALFVLMQERKGRAA